MPSASIRHMAPILNFRVIFLLVNSKFHVILVHNIFQTQKGVDFSFPKTYPHITLSNGTNNYAILAVCKKFILMSPFEADLNTVLYRKISWFWY